MKAVTVISQFICFGLIASSIFLSYGMAYSKGGTQAMLKGKKALLIIAQNNFRDEELAKPKGILEKNGVKVTLASSSLKKAKGMLGMVIQPDILLNAIKVEDYDLVVFVGGSGSSEYWDSLKAHQIAQTAFNQNKPLAAICIAPVTLAKAGLLKDRKATVFPSCADQIEEEGAIYTGKPVEQDGLIITATGPESAEAFGQALINALKNQ